MACAGTRYFLGGRWDESNRCWQVFLATGWRREGAGLGDGEETKTSKALSFVPPSWGQSDVNMPPCTA